MIKNFLIFLAILPVILIAKYVYDKDKNKEPMRVLSKLLVGGVAACFLTLAISYTLSFIFPTSFTLNISANDSFFKVLLQCFIYIALIEEGSKLIMTYSLSYKEKAFDEIYDIIIYAVFVSLGFAAFENILYVLGQAGTGPAITTGILRGLLAVPGHAIYGMYMGYYLSLAKLANIEGNKTEEKKNIIKSLIIPTILHGTYDLCCLSAGKSGIIIIVFLIFVITMYIISIKKLKFVATNNRLLIPTSNERPIPKYCSNCGTPANGLFCEQCGHRIQ